MAFNLQKWYEQMNEEDVILAYKGAITSSLITNVLATIEARLDTISENSTVKKRIYNVLVESLQNLFHHIDEPPKVGQEILEDRFAIFIFSKISSGYKISTGNFIKLSKYQMLKDRIDQINYLSKDELKSLYKLILNNEEFSDKGGGGLGMIDIARKTGNRLEYKFFDFNNEYYFFCLDVEIN